MTGEASWCCGMNTPVKLFFCQIIFMVQKHIEHVESLNKNNKKLKHIFLGSLMFVPFALSDINVHQTKGSPANNSHMKKGKIKIQENQQDT